MDADLNHFHNVNIAKSKKNAVVEWSGLTFLSSIFNVHHIVRSKFTCHYFLHSYHSRHILSIKITFIDIDGIQNSSNKHVFINNVQI